MTRTVFGKLVILSVSLVLSLAAAELAVRSVFDPVDYLNPTLVDDQVLGHRIKGHTGGHDEWGFRNARRPDSADIVCIGDSMTYGVAALARESWPAVLAELRGETVYNMGLGGSGPLEYLHLLRTQGITLRPKIVVMGLYLGNDLFDVYNAVRFKKAWSAYGDLGETTTASRPLVFRRPPAKFLGGLRDWLSRNSVLYVVSSQHPVFGFVRERQVATAADTADLVTYRDQHHHVMFDLSPQMRFLDLRDQRIAAATEIAKRVILDIRSIAERESLRLVVALVPTKELVYRRLLEGPGHRETYARLAGAIDQEETARAWIIGFLRAHDIEIVDLLPALETEVVHRDLFPVTDPHPNGRGYRVIAETIDRYLDSHRRPPREAAATGASSASAR